MRDNMVHALVFALTRYLFHPCRYIDELMRLKAAAREEGSDYLTWNDIQACIDQVNNTIQEEHESE